MTICPFRKIPSGLDSHHPAASRQSVIIDNRPDGGKNWHHRAMLGSGAWDLPPRLEAAHSQLRAAQMISDCWHAAHQAAWFQDSTLTRPVHLSRLSVAEHARL